MTEIRPIRWRYGPGTSGGSADSAVLAECAMRGLLALQPLDCPATDIRYRCVCSKVTGCVPRHDERTRRRRRGRRARVDWTIAVMWRRNAPIGTSPLSLAFLLH